MAKVTVGDILDRMEGIDRDCEVRVLRSAWRSSPEYLKQDQDIVFLDDLYRESERKHTEQERRRMKMIGIIHGDWEDGCCVIYKVFGNDLGEREKHEVARVNDRGLVAEVAETVARMFGFEEVEYYD